MLKRTDLIIVETVGTLSDGCFYAMNLLPGENSIAVDRAQLSRVQAVSTPEVIKFYGKALAVGDCIEGLHFIVI